MIRINNLKMPLDTTLDKLKTKAAEQLQCNEAELKNFRISKKSVDARNKSKVHFVFSADCEIDKPIAATKDIEILAEDKMLKFRITKPKNRPIVVGSGPAGMFAGIALAEAGLNPIILERGEDVDSRQKKVSAFWQGGKLNTESNVQFGEGGAGTFSDGKLMSGIKKDKFVHKVMYELYANGAPEEILYLAKPHIGTDKLRYVVKNIRRKIEKLGGEYRFNSKLEDLVIKNNVLQAVIVNNGGKKYELPATQLFLAVGHSARDTFEMLYKSGVAMQQKVFSVGVRIEHLQSMINKAQYGKAADSPYLGAADYKMATHLPNGRSAYTFCMCPGGSVIAAASENGRVVTNGMSEFARDKQNANAALLVGVGKTDFGSDEVLAGMYFQQKLEEKAFVLGGKNYFAPAQLVGDFLQSKSSIKCHDVLPSYRPGVTFTDLGTLFSTEIADTLRSGITEMAKKLHGFDDYGAVITGVESRSSSPVRILRDESMQSNVKGIYPCGEGAGYAGGITSSAADALKVVYSLNEE
ncbi:MAG: FAD-binding protein [Alphaproteobacteria bacterium]|nr:FAD-binding protein [Alphaproteobacteria bacterium]